MATYKIMYWQEVPSQVRCEDDEDEVSLEMPPKFIALIDRLAMERGLAGTDDYLAQWHWSEEQEREGSAREVAEALVAELAAKQGLR